MNTLDSPVINGSINTAFFDSLQHDIEFFRKPFADIETVLNNLKSADYADVDDYTDYVSSVDEKYSEIRSEFDNYTSSRETLLSHGVTHCSKLDNFINASELEAYSTAARSLHCLTKFKDALKEGRKLYIAAMATAETETADTAADQRKSNLPSYFYQTQTGKICVDPALLLIHIQKQERYFWVASDAMDGVRRYFYNEQRGVYEWLSDERIKGRIKNYITKELSTAVKVKDINETFNLLVLDECRYSDSAIDSSEQLVNFENGFYNIETGQILPHSSGVLSTIQLSLRFDPTRNYTLDDAPNFKQYITTITNGDPEKQTLMLEYMGAALSNVPGYKFKSALFLVGAGNTGKSKYIELIYSLLGEGNFASISFADLEERFQSGAIYGKRLVCDADMKVQRAKGNSLFMKITGGDPVQIEYKGMNPFTTKHRGFLLFASNAMPRWSGNTTDAAYNRMMIIECNNVIPPERQDPDLLNKLLSERSVIVSLALDALRGAVQRGYKFTRPATMTASINKLRRDNCPSIDFFETCCAEFDDANSNYKHCMKRSVMHRVFVDWCRINAPSAYIPSARDFYHDILQYKQLPDGSLIKIWHGHRYYTFTLTLDAKEQFHISDNVN